MPPVTRKHTRVQDGTEGGGQKWTGMSINCPVNICSKCGKVVAKLYDGKCLACKGKS